MSFLEIKQSGPDVPDGTYPMILTAIDGDPENADLPRHVVPDNGPNAGKDLYFWDWKFAIDAPGHPTDGEEFKYGTSTKTGAKSKMFGLLTALLNGQKPSVGMVFEKGQLIGRRVLATVQRDEAGYCEIVSFSAMPVQLQQQAYAAATGAPVAAAPAQAVAAPQPVQAVAQPVAAPVAAPVAPNPTPAPSTVPQAPAAPTDQLPF